MKMKCPSCNQTIKEFTPTQSELSYFDEEEITKGEALLHKPCKECRDDAH